MALVPGHQGDVAVNPIFPETPAWNVVDLRWPMTETLNANQRLHWAQRSARTRNLRQIAYLRGRGAVPMQRARLTVEIGWPDKRRRDAHNLMPTLKACIDGFVDAGVLPDDSDAHLVGPDLRPYVAGIKGAVHLTFTFEPIP